MRRDNDDVSDRRTIPAGVGSLSVVFAFGTIFWAALLCFFMKWLAGNSRR
jgi:hypothetical protein